MITREEYNQAINIIELYNKQLKLPFVKRRDILIRDLGIDDFVICVSLDWNMNKCLTMGKTYQIIAISGSVDYGNRYFNIIDDNGKEKHYVCDKFKTFKPYIPDYILNIENNEPVKDYGPLEMD